MSGRRPRAGRDERTAVLAPHLFEWVPLIEGGAAGRGAVADRAALVGRRPGRESARVGWGSAIVSAGVYRVPAQLRELVEGLALRRPQERVSQAHRAAYAAAADAAWPAPTYGGVRRIVKGLDAAFLAMDHHDRDTYRDG